MSTRRFGAFFHDLLHGVLHFEGKIWRTLPMLAWRPGQADARIYRRPTGELRQPDRAVPVHDLPDVRGVQRARRDQALIDSVDVDAEAATEQAYTATNAKIAAVQRRLNGEEDADDRARLEAEIARLERQREVIGSVRNIGGADTAEESDGLADTGLEINGGEVTARGGLESAWQKAKENPQLLAYKVQTNAYKFAWLLIPISVPFVALTFLWRRRFGIYDHTIFTTYSITFMLALAFVASLVSYFVSGRLGFVLLLYAPVHMYWQLRGTYELGRFSALWRMLALSVFAWWAIAMFAGVLVCWRE